MLNEEQLESNLFPQNGKIFSKESDKIDKFTTNLSESLLYYSKPIKKKSDIGTIALERVENKKNIFPKDFITEYNSMLNILNEDPDFSYLLGIDCEMCITKNGPELTRISLIDPYFHVIFDSLVLPNSEILDYCTKYSGITMESMQGVDVTIDDILNHLDHIIHSKTILIGHSLENDFVACKIKHSRVIDTSVLYQATNQTFKFSLASLAWKYFKVDMHRELGHDSVNDARVAMALAVNWIVKGYHNGELLTTHICNAFIDNSIILKSKENTIKLEREVNTIILDTSIGDCSNSNNSNESNVENVQVDNLSDEEMAKKFVDTISDINNSKTNVGVCFLRDIQREALNGLKMTQDRILAEMPCSVIYKLIKNASEATETIARALEPGSYLFITSCSGDAARCKLLSTLHYVLAEDGDGDIPICDNLSVLSKELGVSDFDLSFDELKDHASKLGKNQLIRESQLAKTNFKASWGAAAVKI